jgi:hypothetical protein
MFRLLLFDTLFHPFFLIPFALLVALWGFAMVDAVRGAGRLKPAAEE